MAWFQRRPNRWGMLLLAVWLILHGLLSLAPSINFQSSGLVLAVLAIAAGVLLVLDR